MKIFKKWTMVFLFATLAVCLAMLFACTPPSPVEPTPSEPTDTDKPTQPQTEFSVTVASYDETMGSVKVDAPANGDKYQQGESVTVTVTAAEGCKIESFLVSGRVSAHLTNGKYTFPITQDTTITVTFALLQTFEDDTIGADVLASLSGSALFSGIMSEWDPSTGESYYSVYNTLFDEQNDAIYYESFFLDQLTSAMLLKNVDGKANLVLHDEYGKVYYEPSEDDFADYDNPFKEVVQADFERESETEWTLKNLELAREITAVLTTYEENVTKFKVTVVSDQAVSLSINCYDEYFDLQRVYNFDVTNQGTAHIPQYWLENYPETEAHDVLREALQRASLAKSYTVNYHSEEYGQEDLDYQLFYTENGIYENLTDWENGYVERPDGNVWAFYLNDEGEFYFSPDFQKNLTLKDLGADFVVQEASLSLLEYKGDGVYTMRPIDTIAGEYYSVLPGYFAQYFATGLDEPRYFSTATSFEIELRDGELYRVQFSYNFYGQISEDVTLIFDKFDSTELPISLSKQFIDGTVSGDYCGNWADDSFEYALTVTPDSIRINGDPAENIAASQQGGYTFTVGGASYQMLLNEDVLVLSTGSKIVYLHRSVCPWLDFVGIYSGFDGADVPYSVVIGEKGLTLFVGGSVTAIEEFEYGFEFSQEQQVYIYTFDFVYNGAHAFLYLNANQSNQFIYGEDHDDDASDKTVVLTISECRWEKFLGAYETTTDDGTEYRVVISPYGIYIYADEILYETEVTLYDSYEGFTFRVDGVDDLVCIGQNGYTNEVKSIGLYWEKNIRSNITLDRVIDGGAVHPTDELFKPEFWGTWVSEDGLYTVVITANVLTINGEEITASYDGYGGYQIVWGEYVAMELAPWAGEGYLVMSNADISKEIYFQKQI